MTGSAKQYVLWELGSWKTGPKIARDRSYLPGTMAFSPDAKLLALANSQWDLQLIDPGTGRQVATLPNPDSRALETFAFSPDGSQLAVPSIGGFHEIRLLDLRAIRGQLADMGLDWDLPPYPPPPPWSDPSEGVGQSSRTKPMRVQLDLGEWLDREKYSAVLAFFPFHAEGYYQRGLAYMRFGQSEKALNDLNMALTLKPDHAEACYKRGLLLARQQAAAFHRSGQWDKAVAEYAKAIELTPDDAILWNNQAWLLATCPDAKVRDAPGAVSRAKKALELQPQEGIYWNTLGVAHYRMGDWKDAVTILENSMEILNGPFESFNTFFLAMAHWKLGEKEQARKWYDQAVQWMEKNQPRNEEQSEELRRFRAEAAELLGIKDRPTAKDKEKQGAKALSR